MKHFLSISLLLVVSLVAQAQVMKSLPASGGNIKSAISQRIGITDMSIHWDAPRVKGRDGKIWGTNIAHYGFQNLGYGTSKAAPWRAGANENTTMEFSTDVMVENKSLAAGKYGFFIAVYPDSCTLIFSRNSSAWGSYFYNPAEDVLRVTVRQQKNLPQSREWLAFEFSEQTENNSVVSLLWEHWKIPFQVKIDVQKAVFAALHQEMQSEVGFYEQNLNAAADYYLQNNHHLDEALAWMDNAVGSNASFPNLRLKADILRKMNRGAEADKTMESAFDKANPMELHQYGRQLIADKNPSKAMEVFQLNYKKNGETWPTHAGLMRGYSAMGDLKKALEQAKIAQKQAPDELSKQSVEAALKTLSEGKPL